MEHVLIALTKSTKSDELHDDSIHERIKQMHQRLEEARLSSVAPRNPDWSELSLRPGSRKILRGETEPSQ